MRFCEAESRLPAGIFLHQRCYATVDHLPLFLTAGQLEVIGAGRRLCFAFRWPID
jgi:hypothetical protein